MDKRQIKLNASVTGALFRELDWASTPLGEPETWDPQLLGAVQNCLNTRFPMTVALGDAPSRLINVYNDGYLPILSNKHPEAFGAPLHRVYSEIWDSFLEERMRTVFDGETIEEHDFLIPLIRGGQLREGYFDFSYSPIIGSDGAVKGAMSIAAETTEKVLERRRNVLISRLGSRLLALEGLGEVSDAIAELVASSTDEFSEFALLEDQPGAGPAVLAASSTEFSEFATGLRIHWNKPVDQIDEDLVVLSVEGEALRLPRGAALVLKVQPLVALDRECFGFLYQLRREFIVHGKRIRESDRLERQRERQYRALFEHSFDGILMTSPTGEIHAANPSACELLGYTEEEIIAGGRDLIVANAEQVRHALHIRELTGRFTGEIEYVCKDGTVICCDVTSVTYSDSDGQRAMIVFRDASERKKLEARNERSARLEAVGQLTGGMAHDFNNLLQLIVGAAEDLQDDIDDRELRVANAGLILSTSLKAAELVRQLMTFARKQPLQARLVNVRTIVEQLDQLIDRASEGHATVRLVDEAWAYLDPAQLESALINLVLNARDALEEKGGEIAIELDAVNIDSGAAAELECEAGRYVRLGVIDTGEGIRDRDLSRVVEPFFSTKSASQGTGLGLSMVYGFVRQSGGAFRIDSTVGRGTKVELFFPARTAPSE